MSGLTTDAISAHFAAALVPSTDQAVGSSRTWGSVARCSAAFFSAACRRWPSILQRLKPMVQLSSKRDESQLISREL